MKIAAGIKTLLIAVIGILLMASCSTTKTRVPQRQVKMAFNLKSSDNNTNFVNLDYYKFQLISEIERFQNVEFNLVEPNENPEVIIDLNVDNFIVWPRNERRVRRSFSRNVVVGSDANGRPVYQTVSAAADVVDVQIRSNARFIARLNIKGETPKTFERTFAPSYNYRRVFVDNIMGDSRALPSDYLFASNSAGFEPRDEDFLLLLSKQDLVQRISNELRTYYQK